MPGCAHGAARPAHPRVADITRAELAEIVRRIQAADPETDHYSRVLDAGVSNPDWAALIFDAPALSIRWGGASFHLRPVEEVRDLVSYVHGKRDAL